jgi:hypothetical protein
MHGLQVSDSCPHPNDCVVYYSEYDEFDDVYEDYWCAKCKFWLTPGEMMMIRERPDFVTPVTEDEIRRRTAPPEAK